MSDPEIDEVRISRREISAQFGHDIHAVLDYYRGIKHNLGADEQTAYSPNQIETCLTGGQRASARHQGRS
jgi:hypothetical protein